jgi:molybdopterin molybdotransferase
MTGAKMPVGADTVIMQEQVTREDDAITVVSDHACGENVRLPGDDIKQGSVVLAAGKRLTPADLGVVASLGIGELNVFRPLKVAFFSTGDELRPVGEPLSEGQIYDSNRYTLHGMLKRVGVEFVDLGIVPDQREAVEQAFEAASRQGDVVITSGGVSVGEADFVKDTLEKLGLVSFWKIAMKPGKPLAFGRIHEAVFFGLPGNPVSVMATFYQLVQPALRKMSGETTVEALTLQIRTSTPLKKQPGRTDFQRGILHYDENGELRVASTGMQGSHVLSSMSEGNCFVVLPAEWGSVETGTLVTVQPFAALI